MYLMKALQNCVLIQYFSLLRLWGFSKWWLNFTIMKFVSHTRYLLHINNIQRNSAVCQVAEMAAVRVMLYLKETSKQIQIVRKKNRQIIRQSTNRLNQTQENKQKNQDIKSQWANTWYIRHEHWTILHIVCASEIESRCAWCEGRSSWMWLWSSFLGIVVLGSHVWRPQCNLGCRVRHWFQHWRHRMAAFRELFLFRKGP